MRHARRASPYLVQRFHIARIRATHATVRATATQVLTARQSGRECCGSESYRQKHPAVLASATGTITPSSSIVLAVTINARTFMVTPHWLVPLLLSSTSGQQHGQGP